MYRERGRRPVKLQGFEVQAETLPKVASSKRIRCGRCGPCNTPDCGKCEHCKKKKKFGGDGSSRNACKLRHCVAIHGSNLSPDVSGPLKAPPGDPVVSHVRKVPHSRNSQTAVQATLSEAAATNLDSSSDNNGGKPSGFKKKVPPVKRPFSLMTNMEASLFPPAVLPLKESQEMGGKICKGRLPDEEEGDEDKLAEEPALKNNAATRYYRRFLGRKAPPAPTLGVCAICGENEDHHSDPVLLCDGKGCDRENHLKCIGLEEVPDGDWFCVDCHPTGRSCEALVNYLELMDETRSGFGSKAAFLMSLFQADMEITDPNKIPESELSIAQKDMLREPRWLIGKPVWIKVPKVKSYVTGRIIDYRGPARRKSSAACKEEDPGVWDEQEYLIRFPAGHIDHKEHYYHWIKLEEHTMIVGDRIVWTVLRDSGTDPHPALALLRTSRDLISSPPKTSRHKQNSSPYSIAYSFEAATFVDVIKVTSCDFFDPVRQKMYGALKPTAMAAIDAELQEQLSVMAWQSLPQGNPFHPLALKNRDYFSLPPINPDDSQKKKKYLELEQGESHTELCPLIMTGIDPAQVMKILKKSYGLEPNKELAASLTCRTVPYQWPRGEELVEPQEEVVSGARQRTNPESAV